MLQPPVAHKPKLDNEASSWIDAWGVLRQNQCMNRSLIASCLTLLCAAHTGFAASLVPGPELQAAAEKQWAKAIADLETRDQRESHPADSILFVGSSSIRLWNSIVPDMAPYHPIQRGYGGAKFSDVTVFAKRLIAPHQFRAMVVFVANDVTGRPDDPTPEQVAGWFGHIVDVARAAQPDAPIFCLEVTPTQSRWQAWPKIREVNRALAQECLARPNVDFIPTAHAYLGSDGKPQAELFRNDRLHLSPLGYRIWSAIIKSHLDAVLDPDFAIRKR